MNTTSIRDYPRPALRVPGYLSVRAAAELLGIRERSVRELVERRRLASAFPLSGQWFAERPRELWTASWL